MMALVQRDIGEAQKETVERGPLRGLLPRTELEHHPQL